MSKSGIQMSESYVVSTFKSCLNEKYRLFADELVTIKTYGELLTCLMIWEQNFLSRKRHLPTLKPSRVKASVAQKPPCPFCKKGVHDDDKCWSKHPELNLRNVPLATGAIVVNVLKISQRRVILKSEIFNFLKTKFSKLSLLVSTPTPLLFVKL